MTVVRTSGGEVKGTTTVTRRADVESYLGIPFAGAPTGRARFKPPQPVEPWTGVRNAKRAGPAAPQNPDPLLARGGFRQQPHDEAACLNLNVWTPRADDRDRPVLVWIHGGANVSGSNSSGYNNGAELAASLDVVVVSLNYRLGALGFLVLDHLLGPEYSAAANVAVLDQLAALAWVRDNIAAFGGDPDKVTVFGESAGGAAVGTLLGTPRSEGLFRRAIMQSGSAERARPVDESRAITAELLDAAGIRERDAEQLLTLEVHDLLAAQAVVVARHSVATVGLPLPFQSSVDGDILPAVPLQSIAAGTNSTVDLLAGTNLNEGAFFTAMRPERSDDTRGSAELFDELTDDDLRGLDAVEYRAALADCLGHQPNADELLEAALSDHLYRQPTNRLLDARAEAVGRTFAYLFTWPSPLMGGALGACHALEVPFVFRQLHRLETISLVGDKPPIELSEWISGAWVEFARRGAPQSPALPDWPEYEPRRRATMLLNRHPRVEDDPRGRLRAIWDRVSVG